MTEELLRLRVRGAPLPRPHSPARSQRPPRRALLLHVHADESERVVRAALVELLDGEPIEVLVGLPGAPIDGVQAWALARSLDLVADGISGPTVGSLGEIGRRVVRRCGKGGAALVGFDLPWTIGRMATDVRKARARLGLSVALAGTGWSHRETGRWLDSHYIGYRLRIEVRGGQDGAFMDWIPPRRRKGHQRHGTFVDLAVLGGALGANASAAASLVASYGLAWPNRPDPLDQLVDEALALAACWRLTCAELAELAPGLAPQSCWSAGSIVMHALRRAGVRDPVESTSSLPRAVLGITAASSHGGRVEALFVGQVDSMALVDLTATYPRLFSLLGLTPQLAADHFEATPLPLEEVKVLFDLQGLRARLDDRAWWRAIGSLFVEVEPHGEQLPCQREAAGRFRTVTAPLDLSGGRLWFHACDLVCPALEKQLPVICAAVRVEPRASAEGLTAVRLPSGHKIDLTREDWGLALVEVRRLASEIANPLVRSRREVLAKEIAVSGAWGIFGRADRRRAPKPQASVLVDANGEERGSRTGRLDLAGPLTLWHLASAIPAACRAIIAMAEHDLRISAAAVMTDAIAVAVGKPGPSREALRSALCRFDALLCPDGGSAWKGEAGSLDAETIGLVVGMNKVLLGLLDDDGRFELVRSSDSGLGEHYLDPTGTGERLGDGRTAWSAQLEEPLLAELADAAPGTALRVPRDLPAWVDQPALRPARASTLEDLRQLRQATDDPSIGPYVRYVTTIEGGPICLGTGRDPAAWSSWPWRHEGRAWRLAVQLPGGELVTSVGGGPVFVVPTLREVFRGWLREHDVTAGGPERGLRHVLPVRSHPALVEVVGRSGERPGEIADDDPVSFGTVDVSTLVTQAKALSAAEITRRSGLAGRTAREAVAGSVEPSPSTILKLAVAVTSGPAERRCAAGSLCRRAVGGLGARLGPRQLRWCCDACERVMARRARGIPGRRSRSTASLSVRPDTESTSRAKGSAVSVIRAVSAKEFAGDLTCSQCRSIFMGAVPQICPDCEAPLPERVTA